MSLILEALKKLDRDKQAPERGFLVVGAAAWPGGEGRGRGPALIALGAVLLAAAAAYLWLAPAKGPRSPVALPAAAGPAPATSPAPAAAPTPLPADQPAPRGQPLPAGQPMTTIQPNPVPSRRPPSPERTFTLTAISQQDGHAVAVLNDRLVREGDMFDGVRILRIGEAEVEIEVDGRRHVVAF